MLLSWGPSPVWAWLVCSPCCMMVCMRGMHWQLLPAGARPLRLAWVAEYATAWQILVGGCKTNDHLLKLQAAVQFPKATENHWHWYVARNQVSWHYIFVKTITICLPVSVQQCSNFSLISVMLLHYQLFTLKIEIIGSYYINGSTLLAATAHIRKTRLSWLANTWICSTHTRIIRDVW